MIDAAAEVIRALRAGRAVVMHPTGGSMDPWIASGARVRIEPCSPAAVSLGDVAAVVRPEGGLTLHRVVARDGGALVTWGDALPSPDSGSAEDVVGRVVHIECAPDTGGRGRLRRARGRLRVAWHFVVAWRAKVGRSTCGSAPDP